MNALAPLILPPLSVVYGAITRARLALYQRGTLPVFHLEAPVISVGNITTGGTGKTPLVEWLARALIKEGQKVCILTRGYGRVNASERIIVSDGDKVLATASEAGDEALLLANNLKGLAVVIADADRFAAGRWALKQFAVDTFVLDDGFQHLRLERDLNIVTVDATYPWGGGQLLPYGRLREPLSGLRRADCIVVTRADQVKNTQPMLQRLELVSGGRPVFFSKMYTCGFSLRVNNQTINSVSSPQGRLAAFCGIGNPKAFFDKLRSEGYELALTRVFPDHHSYDEKELCLFIEEAKKIEVKGIVTTAKDAVKLTAFAFDIPCYILQIELALEDERSLLRMIRKSISTSQDRRP